MSTTHVMKVSSNGQVSIPAEARALEGGPCGRRRSRRPGGAASSAAGASRRAERKVPGTRSEQRTSAAPGSDRRCGTRAAAVIVLDAYAVIAFLKGEAAAGQVAQLLAGEEETTLTALGVAEVVDHLVRLVGTRRRRRPRPCPTGPRLALDHRRLSRSVCRLAADSSLPPEERGGQPR